MISTGELMLGKALLTAAAIFGFCLWQLRNLRRLRREREAREAKSAQHRGEETQPRVNEQS